MLGLNNYRNNPDSELPKNKIDGRLFKPSRGKFNPINSHTKRYPQRKQNKIAEVLI